MLTALAVSGLPVDRFCFEGFLPRKKAERRKHLEEMQEERRTMVFFEAPHRTAAALLAMGEVFGRWRPAAVCRELTKTHEEIRRGSLGELAAWAAIGVRGEVTVVVQGAARPAPPEVDADALRQLVDEEVLAGRSRKDAVDTVAASTGIARKAVYAAAHRAS